MTLDNLLAWAQINLRGLQGKDCAVLKAASIKRLHTPLGNGEGTRYGLGWVEDTLNGKVVSWHNGNVGDATAYVLIDPAKDRVAVALANASVAEKLGSVARKAITLR